MSTPEKPSYAKYQGMKELGDRALSAKQYEMAIEYYEKALLAFNIPNHPKYLAVLEGIKKAKKEITITSGHIQPKTYVPDGMIKPSKIYLRLYSRKQLPETRSENIALRVFTSLLETNPPLKAIFELADGNCEILSSWEYMPYDYEAFKTVAENRSQTYFESLFANPGPKLCRSFSAEIFFSLDKQQVRGILLIVAFGDQMA